ncbi:MAG: prepilin peptidase [Paracoccaceae bacterium]
MLTPTSALWFLPFVLPVALWVSWSDMKFMKIPNRAVMVLVAVYALVGLGLIAMSHLAFEAWLWGWAVGAIVLVAGFLLNALGALGAGDAKFAAAMAPFFYAGDVRFLLGLFAACVLGAFVSHRVMRAIPAMRRATPDWASWTHHKFPMGLALAGTLVFYLLAVILL